MTFKMKSDMKGASSITGPLALGTGFGRCAKVVATAGSSAVVAAMCANTAIQGAVSCLRKGIYIYNMVLVEIKDWI